MDKLNKKQKELCKLIEDKNYYWINIIYEADMPKKLEVTIWNGVKEFSLDGNSYRELIDIVNSMPINSNYVEELNKTVLYEQTPLL